MVLHHPNGLNPLDGTALPGRQAQSLTPPPLTMSGGAFPKDEFQGRPASVPVAERGPPGRPFSAMSAALPRQRQPMPRVGSARSPPLPSPRRHSAVRLPSPRLEAFALRDTPIVGGGLQARQLAALGRRQEEERILLADLQASEEQMAILERESWRIRGGAIVPAGLAQQLSEHIDVQQARHAEECQALTIQGNEKAAQVSLLHAELSSADGEVKSLYRRIGALETQLDVFESRWPPEHVTV